MELLALLLVVLVFVALLTGRIDLVTAIGAVVVLVLLLYVVRRV